MLISLRLRSGTALICITLMLFRLFTWSTPSWAGEIPRTSFTYVDTQFYQSLDGVRQPKIVEPPALAPTAKLSEQPFQTIIPAPFIRGVPRTSFSQADTKLYESLDTDQRYEAAGLLVLASSDTSASPFQVENEKVTGAEIIQNLAETEQTIPPATRTVPETPSTGEDPFEVANEGYNFKETMQLLGGLMALALLVLLIVGTANPSAYCCY